MPGNVLQGGVGHRFDVRLVMVADQIRGVRRSDLYVTEEGFRTSAVSFVPQVNIYDLPMLIRCLRSGADVPGVDKQ